MYYDYNKLVTSVQTKNVIQILIPTIPSILQKCLINEIKIKNTNYVSTIKKCDVLIMT